MIDITLIVNSDNDIKRFQKADLKEEPYVTILNESYHSDKKKAWDIKNEWGAKEVPFIIVNKDMKHLKTIYKEASEDPINELINLINNL